MTDILPPAGWPNVRQLETNEFATGGFNGNMNEQAKSLAARSELLKQYAALPYESKTGGYALNERVQLATGDIVRSTIPSNVNNPNENMTGWVKTNAASQIFDSSGISQQSFNTFSKSLLVSPMLFGAVGDGVADDSAALNSAISFAITNNATLDGQGKTYACHSVKFDSNTRFKNANLICNKFDQDMVSVLECTSYDDDPLWL